MSAVLIAYDLHKLGQRYHELRTLVKKTFPIHWDCLESTFIISTTWTTVQVRDVLRPAIDENDELLVVALTPSSWATLGFSKSCNDWLRTNV